MSRILPLKVSGTGTGDSPPFQRIAIIGFGLIGGSIGRAVRDRFPSAIVIAIDSKDVIETAMRMHAADVGGDDLILAQEAELIVLAAPVRQNLTLLQDVAEQISSEAVLTDVGSTKAAIMEAAAGLPPTLRFIGGHPLAGAAAEGLEASRPDLFAGRPWLLTPAASARPDDVSRLETLVSALGGVPRIVDPTAHDRLVAYLSHLPQLAASALMHVVGSHVGDEGLALAGRGLRDTTRLASSPPAIWRDIASTNDAHLGAALDVFIEVLTELRQGLPDTAALDRVFESARLWKSRLEHDR